MLEKATRILKDEAAGKKLAVAVSGGRDSMCLLSLVLSCDFIRKEDVVVVNIEHGIRGDESLADSEFVRAYCEDRGVTFVCEHMDIPALRKISGRGDEEEARLARRAVFAKIIESGRAEKVLTAHHRGDNAETVLMHILRGSGSGGLRGMDVRTADGFLRPLLTTGRAEIDEYIAFNAVPYVEDGTNADTKYMRNFVRHAVMPTLSARFDAESALVRLAETARADDDFITSLLDKNAVEAAPLGGVKISSDKLLGARATASRYALEMLKKLTGDYTLEGVEAVLKCASLPAGCGLDVCGNLRAANEYGCVTLYKKSDKRERVYPFSLGTFDFGGFTAVIEKCAFPGKQELKSGKSLYVSAAAVPSGAVLRTRRAGDRIEPFGGGTRKLKELFIDRKIPSRLRAGLPLLCDGERVLAVFGVEISKTLKAEENVGTYRLTLYEGDTPWKEQTICR